MAGRPPGDFALLILVGAISLLGCASTAAGARVDGHGPSVTLQADGLPPAPEWRPPPLAWERTPDPTPRETDPVEAGEEPFPEVSVEVLFPGTTGASSRAAVALAPPLDLAAPLDLSGIEEALSRLVPDERDGRVDRVGAHLARRMRGAAAGECETLAAVVVESADWARLDPLLLLAIIEVESGFDPGALSSRGARGLMQLLPATLRQEAALFGIAGSSPHEPRLNVAAGALYFRRLLDAFGRTDVALMAYNAGPNRILRHIRAGAIPERYFEYPRRVRAAEARLRRDLPLEPGRTLAARRGVVEPRVE
jgi:hypothetical protein